MSMISLGIAYQQLARQKNEENVLNQKIRERRTNVSLIKSLREELAEAYTTIRRKTLEDSINSLDSLFTEMNLAYGTLLPQTRITQIDENTPPGFVDSTIRKFNNYLGQIIESSQRIRELNYKQDVYRGKLPTITAVLYNLKKFASTISNQINFYLDKENPTALEQTKILHFIDTSLEQITRKYRREIRRSIPKRTSLINQNLFI